MSEIRSYRSVFDLERRIYRIDGLRLNPGGVPVRGVVYGLALLAATALADRAPLLDRVVGLLPWYLRELVAPVAGAALLAMIRVEGRPFHLAAVALVRYAWGPRHLSGMRRCAAPGGRWWPPELLALPDGSEARLRRLRYTGPGAMRVRAPHECSAANLGPLARRLARPRLLLREPAPDASREPIRGRVIVLERGVRARVG